jgi:osmotically-inducible protein OsmY
VLLTGEAPDEATRQEIAKIVLGVPGVRAVTNEIQLAPPTTRSSRINDEYITVKLKSRLLGSSRVSLVHAKTVVEDGVVYLLGLVTEQEAEEAVEIARTIEYCKPSDEVCRPAPPPQEMPNRRANAPAQGS